jgi:hypothetical protein
VAVMLRPVKFHCVEAWISTGLPYMYIYSWPYVVSWTATGAKFDFRRIFQNVTTAYVGVCLHNVKTNFQCNLPIRNPIRTDLWSKPGLWGNRVNVPRSHLYLGRPQFVIMVTVSCELILQSSCHYHMQFYSDSWVLFVRDEDSVSRYLDLERPAPPVTRNMNSWQCSR